MEAHSESSLHRLERELARVSGDRISIGSVIDALGPGGWGLCFLLFGLTALVPGIAPVFGVALCILAVSMVVGHDRPWLPNRIRSWQTNRAKLTNGLTRLRPLVSRIERRLRPRGEQFLSGGMLRVAGLAALINAVLVVLPVPFGNTAPAIATLVLALGLTTGDGFAVLAGLVLTIFAILVDVLFVWTGYQAVLAMIGWLF